MSLGQILNITAVAAITGGLIYLAVGTTSNLDYVKERAEARWQQAGSQVVGYTGYQRSMTLTPEYGGAKVWYSLRGPQTDVMYTGFLRRWGDEIHVYGPRAVNSIITW